MSDAPISASDGDLRRVSKLAAEYVIAEKDIGRLEAELKTAKEVYRKIAEEDLPDAMHQAGLAEFLTSEGREVKVKPVISASWPGDDRQDRRTQAIAFLTEEDSLDLITAEVVVQYSRKDYDQATAFFDEARKINSAKVKLIERVHPQTLSAWVRERLKNGQRMEYDAFNVRSIIRATVK